MMNRKTSVRLAGFVLLGAILTSACQYSYSQAPAASPTLIPTNFFVSPIPPGDNPMQLVENLGTQTALAAQTGSVASGTAITPSTPATPTATLPFGTNVTPLTGASSTPSFVTPNIFATTPAPATVIPITGTLIQTVVIPTVSGGLPTTYTLQAGEWPFCIARRYNVDPDELRSLNGLSDDEIVQPGLVLRLPQTGNPFPGTRAWHTHPDTYIVSGNNDTTLYGVACYYGDIFPQAIAQSNNLALSTTLTVGQRLIIP